MNSKLIAWGLAVAVCAGAFSQAHSQTFRRKPFIQRGSPTKALVCWRTTTAFSLTVRFGTDSTNLNRITAASPSDTSNCVVLDTLQHSTKYFYEVYNGATKITGSANQYLITHPPVGTRNEYKFWVVGDAGTGGVHQQRVRDGFVKVNPGTHSDGFLQLGDNAYETGTHAEYTSKNFAIYPDILANTFTWPTIGNHEGGNNTMPGGGGGPHKDAFNLPTNGESGGVASGSELYYSWDYGNIHFICLDSYVSLPRSTSSNQYIWLLQDLQATTQDWIVAYWHHPPYSKGGHNSDTEQQLIDMRTVFLPLLEQYGVDFVFGGHSHTYERTYLIDSAYGNSANNLANKSKVVKDTGWGNPDSVGGPYRKASMKAGHLGAVYAVVGNGGQSLDAFTAHHPMLKVKFNTFYGSGIFTVKDTVATLTHIDSTGAVRDKVQIVKTRGAPVSLAYSPATSYPVNAAMSLSPALVGGIGTVTYSLASDTLPAGVSLSSSSGIISGTPTATGSSTVAVTASTSGGSTTSPSFNIVVVNGPPIIAYATPVSDTVGKAASHAVSSTGGPVNTYSVTAPPALPAGLSIDAGSGLISGTPTAATPAANYTITAAGPGGSANAVINITVVNGAPIIAYSPATIADTLGKPASHAVVSTGGAITGFSITPTLPTGLSFNTETGLISGVPTRQSLPALYTVIATGSNGADTATLSLSVYETPSNLAYWDELTIYVLGIPISENIATVSGYITNYSISPALPQGLVLDTTNGYISGTPVDPDGAGPLTGQTNRINYTVTASNPAGSTQTVIRMQIVGAPSNLSYSDEVATYLPGVDINPPNTPTVQGIVTKYSVTPPLPPGMYLDQTIGYIMGTPIEDTQYSNYTIKAENPGGHVNATLGIQVGVENCICD